MCQGAEPGGDPLQGAAPLGGVLGDLDLCRQRGQWLTRGANDQYRPVDHPFEDADGAPQQGRAVPLEQSPSAFPSGSTGPPAKTIAAAAGMPRMLGGAVRQGTPVDAASGGW